MPERGPAVRPDDHDSKEDGPEERVTWIDDRQRGKLH